MESIGVRELRQYASRWLARVAAGESFEITDRGHPVASLVPVPATSWDVLEATGSVVRATGSLLDVEPAPPTAAVSLSDALLADREDVR